MRSYLICATPRTGSYLLCDALRATGVAGMPTEYLSLGYESHWSKIWNTPDHESYLRHVIETRSTPNGIFGAKSHPWQFDVFCRRLTGAAVPYVERPELLEKWFPDLHYVWLRRRNKLHQAISYSKSIQTNVWWDADAPPAPYDEPKPEDLRFDFDLITQSVARMVEEEDMWRRYFAAIELEPLEIDYEDLVTDIGAAAGSVLRLIGVQDQLPGGYVAAAPSLRRQSDEITLAWEEAYRKELARGPYALWRRSDPEVQVQPVTGAGASVIDRPADPETATPEEMVPVPQIPAPPVVDIEEVIGSRRWVRCKTPFPYVYATEVFGTDTYRAMSDQFEGLLSGGRFARSIPGYDVSAYMVTGSTPGALSVFSSREWHELLAGLFDVKATGELNIALHHHAIGSQSGSPHNDLNPGWFAERRRSDGIVVLDPADRCDYRFGSQDPSVETTERVRAVAVIFYLANPAGRYGGGETGLYRAASDPINRPYAVIPPVNNSMIAFECTPWSFHGFITNPRTPRNCLVMWLHRDKAEVVERFGGSNIVHWPR